MENKRFEWRLLQEGSLPLRPDGIINHALEHRPTSTLIWPEGRLFQREHTLLTDPYFTSNSFALAELGLGLLAGVSFKDIGHIFVTHQHYDHQLHFPADAPEPPPPFIEFVPGVTKGFEGITAVPCPGHAPDLRALVFTSPTDERVWVVGDAVLDKEWLLAWRYFWPNNYSPAEIVQTWRSVAMIVAQADVIVPGHEVQIRVTPQCVEELIAGFPRAEHAAECPDVLETLRERLQKFSPSA